MTGDNVDVPFKVTVTTADLLPALESVVWLVSLIVDAIVKGAVNSLFELANIPPTAVCPSVL